MNMINFFFTLIYFFIYRNILKKEGESKRTAELLSIPRFALLIFLNIISLFYAFYVVVDYWHLRFFDFIYEINQDGLLVAMLLILILVVTHLWAKANKNFEEICVDFIKKEENKVVIFLAKNYHYFTFMLLIITGAFYIFTG